MTAALNPARISFDVINLPVRQTLNVYRFQLIPNPDIEAQRKELAKFESPSLVTAKGTFALEPGLRGEQAYSQFWRPSRCLMLLLSFAHRCHIQLLNPRIEHQICGQWIFKGGDGYLFREGKAGSASWYGDEIELKDYLTRSMPKLLDREFADRTGIVLALELYDQAQSERTAEMEFLKYWIAFEILYGHRLIDQAQIVSQTRFDRVRRTIKAVLCKLVEQEHLTSLEKHTMEDKLPELNRMSALQQVQTFLEDIFKNYPAQEVTNVEIKKFLNIRNSITHGGVMAMAEAEDYAEVLNLETGRFSSLLDRVILALLDERPNLMGFTWREWMAAA